MGRDIVKKESPLALYKGLGAVVAGIVPKMAIRFSSFEAYKGLLADKTTGKVATSSVFLAGLGAGVTEAVAVVSPMECIKIRLQAQHHSMADPLDVPRYRNAAHAAYTIVREEGFATLYRGVTLTATRQATNQGIFSRIRKSREITNVQQPSILQHTKNSRSGQRTIKASLSCLHTRISCLEVSLVRWDQCLMPQSIQLRPEFSVALPQTARKD